MNTSTLIEQNESDQNLCQERGIPIFEKPEDLVVRKYEYDDYRIATRKIVIPSIGAVTFDLMNNPNDIDKKNSPAYLIDGQSEHKTLPYNSCLGAGLFVVQISLEDAEPYMDNEMYANLWIRGRSGKFTSLLKAGRNPRQKGDPFTIKMSSSWKPDDKSDEQALFLPLDFDVLKDVQISVEGKAPELSGEGNN